MKNVYIPVSELKRDAKRAMSGNFFRSFYACVMPYVFIWIVAGIVCALSGAGESFGMVLRGAFDSVEAQQDYLSEIIDIASRAVQLVQILFYFLFIGGNKMLFEMLRGGKPGYKTLFSFFPRWFSSAVLSVAAAAPTVLLNFLADKFNSVMHPDDAMLLLVNTSVLVLSLFIMLKLFFAPYLLASGSASAAPDALKKSWRMASLRTMGNILSLALSFIGWFVLTFFTFGAVMIYVIPYMRLSEAALCERLTR